ncbi:MAG: hypothetical protein KJ620_09940 [Candidatus Edwardsbacteria bacterium]|nr:hypothetical protein [Candidatus Edwardsbacteria bacterium]MBU1577645.1 hypothetical protein [Candidatus Edwardsbacteria bacterium]MBU2463006.1 hypothetical protein [Candidatus Edwardsbacteria bacterium]
MTKRHGIPRGFAPKLFIFHLTQYFFKTAIQALHKGFKKQASAIAVPLLYHQIIIMSTRQM